MNKAEEQEKIYADSPSKLKIGEKVRHKTTPQFDMVIKDFKVHWLNNMARMVAGLKNPEYAVCSYYNTSTNKFEEHVFTYNELETIKD